MYFVDGAYLKTWSPFRGRRRIAFRSTVQGIGKGICKKKKNLKTFVRKVLLSLSKDKRDTYYGFSEGIDFVTALIFVNHRHNFIFYNYVQLNLSHSDFKLFI